MAWIRTVTPEHAEGALQTLYGRIKGADGTIDNILLAHSLRPHTLEGHLALYRSILHHPRNSLPKWLLEAVGVYVSMINGCDYCVQHHLKSLRSLVNDDARVDRMRSALSAGRPGEAFEPRETAALDYAARVTRAPDQITALIMDDLRAAGLDDGEILELNQVAAYFAYANRTVLGLGVVKESRFESL